MQSAGIAQSVEAILSQCLSGPPPGAAPSRKKRKQKTAAPEAPEAAAADEVAGHCGVEEVRIRFGQGCECQDQESCFRNINPEAVYKHRLNIAELTRSEQDMYLMGVTMATLSNPQETARHTERKRLRTHYVYQGRKICLEAFLYLENCTQYQLKRIRKHIKDHGVTPRVHGNHGKRPHNRFPLDIYQHATAFLQGYIQKSSPKIQKSGSSSSSSSSSSIQLPASRKTVYMAYAEYMEHFEPGVKVLGYSTLRHFMKLQFPLLKFSDPKQLTAHAHAQAQAPPTC